MFWLDLLSFVLWALVIAFVLRHRFRTAQFLIVAAFVVVGYFAYPLVKSYFVEANQSEGYRQVGDGFFAVVLTTSIGAWVGAIIANTVFKKN